ncbi:MAG: hypothetical protein M3R70_12750 [Actinomycetota bacterium]|nr:hypothetical protein [Actinomycetota bacterium]
MFWKAAAAGVMAIAVCASVAAAGSNRHARGACTPRLENGIVYNCGPAKAKLSKFPRVTFKKGTCVVRPTLFFLSMGTYTKNKRTNNGKQSFVLSVAGRLRNPQGGSVQAFSRGRKWIGRITEFSGTRSSGTFGAQGINGSRGTAHGSYRC